MSDSTSTELSPGKYTASVVETKIGPLGDKGNQALEIQCQLLDHTSPTGFKTEIQGNVIRRVTIWLTSNTIGNQVTQDQLSVFGKVPDVLDDFIANKFQGKEVNLWAKKQASPKDGKEYLNFAISTPNGGGGNYGVKTEATPDDVRKLKALFGGGSSKVDNSPPPDLDPDAVDNF